MKPGLYDGIPEAKYHADRDSLSVSGAKLILKAPALYWHRLDNPEHRDVFDFGSAAHRMVLGAGPEIVEIRVEVETKRGGHKQTIIADSWAFKAADEAREQARADGKIPLLPADYQRVQEMADALSSHTLAMKLLSGGRAEVSAYAPDEATGVMRRCRYDYLRDDLATDYKSAASAEPQAFARAVANFGYHQQAAWYLDVAAALGRPLRGFLFIAQEKVAPYLVTVVELTSDALEVGRALNRHALERFRDCTESGRWPGYTTDTDITPIDLPAWAYRQEIPA